MTPEKRKAYNKMYYQTPNSKKLHAISHWKQYGLIHEDYSALYEAYLQATHCDVCKTVFKPSNDRCMDHDHDTGLFRQFLCKSCNGFDNWKRFNKSSSN